MTVSAVVTADRGIPLVVGEDEVEITIAIEVAEPGAKTDAELIQPPRGADLADSTAKAMIQTTCKAAAAPPERFLSGLRRMRGFAIGSPRSLRPERWLRNHTRPAR